MVSMPVSIAWEQIVSRSRRPTRDTGHECQVIWTDLIRIQNPQTAGGEYGYDSHHSF